MLDFFIGIGKDLFRSYRIRRYLKKQVDMTVNSQKLTSKELIRYYELAEKQTMLRQIFGLASEGKHCRVIFDEKGNATVEDLKDGEKKTRYCYCEKEEVIFVKEYP